MADGLKATNVVNGLDEFDYANKADQAAQAKQLWTDLGLDPSKVSDVDVTFTATVGTDGKPSYAATSGVALDADGNVVAELTETQLAKFVTTAKNGDANTTGMGGFTVNAGGTATVDAIFDATDLTTGDVVAIKFTDPGEAPKAPTNIGFANDSFEFTNTDR